MMFLLTNFALNMFEANFIFYMTKTLNYPLVDATIAMSIGGVLGLISFFGTINVITYFTLRQRTVPKKILGRVVAVTRMISYASIPIGAWFGGLLLNLGEPMFIVIMIAGIIRTCAGIMAKLSPLGKEN